MASVFLSAERADKMPVLFQQVARIARRGRKRWLGLVFVTQLPQHLPPPLFGLVNSYVLHKLADPQVVSGLQRRISGIDEGLWRRLPGLAPGQAIVAFPHLAHGRRHLRRPTGIHHAVGDARHQILAEADLRVHRPRRGQHLAGQEVAQVRGDRGRAHVHREAVDGVEKAGPGRHDARAPVHRHRDLPAALAQVTLQLVFDAGSIRYNQEAEKFHFDCEIAVAAYDASGKIADSFADNIKGTVTARQLEEAKKTGYRYSKRIKLKPGLYQLRSGVRDAASS